MLLTNTPTPILMVAPEMTLTPVLTNGARIPSEALGVTPLPTGEGKVPMITPTIVPIEIATPTPMADFSENVISGLGTEEVWEKHNGQDKLLESETLSKMQKVGEKETLKKSFAAMVMIIVFLLLLPAIVVDHFFRLEKISHRRIIKEMRRKGNVRAIQMLNRSVYRKLCFSGMIKKDCNDKELEEVLRSNYSVVWPQDWDRYMDIVKAAEFSLREFTDEEVMFCYTIYRDVIYLN